MRMIWLARSVAVSGLSAAAAVAAHEGPAALAAGRPLLAALAGATLAVAGVGALLLTAVSRHARAARVRRGDLLAARLEAGAAPGAVALLATLLVAQAAAHAGLIVFGVAAHGAPPAPIAMHVLLALVATAVLVVCERVLRAAGSALADAIAAAAGTLAAGAAPSAAPVVRPRSRAVDGSHRGRAPPLVPVPRF
jgi:hypothetical protein